MTKKNSRKNKQKPNRKNDLPRLGSDKDFLCAFLGNGGDVLKENQEKPKKPADPQRHLNKHGLPFLDDSDTWMDEHPDFHTPDGDMTAEQGLPEPEPDFPTLLEASLKQNRPLRHVPRPMPLKRRLKRYPPPEADLDLHGFTAIGAQIKTRAFISNAHVQGFFTLRIIVGKGLHSQGGPVLPHVVEDLLTEMKHEDIVLAYEWEGRRKSKSGAVRVYLKRFDD